MSKQTVFIELMFHCDAEWNICTFCWQCWKFCRKKCWI